MKGLENQTYLLALLAFNLLALVFLFCAIRSPRVARLLFFVLFGWSCWMNWTMSRNNPSDYLQYADLTFSGWYRDFITGWFSRNIPLAVGLIAAGQGLVALSMLLKGRIFKLGCIGGIVFLLAIVPLGVGSGFPCTMTFAITLLILFRKGQEFWWVNRKKILTV